MTLGLSPASTHPTQAQGSLRQVAGVTVEMQQRGCHQGLPTLPSLGTTDSHYQGHDVSWCINLITYFKNTVSTHRKGLLLEIDTCKVVSIQKLLILILYKVVPNVNKKKIPRDLSYSFCPFKIEDS